MPLAVTHILLTYRPTLLFNKGFFIYNALINCLTCINLTCNFALLCFFGQHFRQTIQYMFGFRKDLPYQKPHGAFLTARDRNVTLFQNMVRLITTEQTDLIMQDDRMAYDLRRKRKSMPAMNDPYDRADHDEGVRRLMSLKDTNEVLRSMAKSKLRDRNHHSEHENENNQKSKEQLLGKMNDRRFSQ
jgi:hypothetical protein